MLERPSKLSLIVIYGPAGAGKTTLAEYLHAKLSYTAYVSVDRIKRFITQFREIPTHQKVTENVVRRMAATYLENNINVIVEYVMTRNDVENFEEIARLHGAQFFAYRLNVNRAVADLRAHARHVALEKPAIPEETLDMLQKIHQENDYLSTATFNTEHSTAEEMGNTILENLRT